ncbi:MAG: hypothetical protein DMF88_10250 [Acidobacteria bacterium]|nr:MAG: hypothetical protein DMF88_10250 [Acidobacteriota bacterium]
MKLLLEISDLCDSTKIRLKNPARAIGRSPQTMNRLRGQHIDCCCQWAIFVLTEPMLQQRKALECFTKFAALQEKLRLC